MSHSINPRILVISGLAGLLVGLALLHERERNLSKASDSNLTRSPDRKTFHIVDREFESPQGHSPFEDLHSRKPGDERAKSLRRPPGARTDTAHIFTVPEEVEMLSEELGELGYRILETLPELGAIRIATPPGTLEQLIRDYGDVDVGFSFPVSRPTPATPAERGSGRLPVGIEWAAAAGLPEQRQRFGSGVKVAVIDDFSTVSDSGAKHGDNVSNFIAETAPASTLIALDIFSSGQADSFDAARAILDAVHLGASVINISLGTYADSPALEAAVQHATLSGAVVVASAGNDSLTQPTFPAAYPDSIAVVASDAANSSASFNNTGDSVDLAAPGVGIVIVPDASPVYGTSFAAPITSGAIAGVMSELNADASTATDLLINHANEADSEGHDSRTGHGVVNVDRAMQASVPGRIDLAIASHTLSAQAVSSAFDTITVVLENRGTERVDDVELNCTINSKNERFYIGRMNPGATTSRQIHVNRGSPEAITIFSTVSAPGTRSDLTPGDNTLGSRYRPPPKPGTREP